MVIDQDTRTKYNCYVTERATGTIDLINNTGADLVQRELTMIQGWFGIVKADSLDGEAVTIEWHDDIVLQTSQIKAGDTFAASTDAAPAWVYWDITNKEVSDTATATYWRIGRLTAPLDGGTFIEFIPLAVPELIV